MTRVAGAALALVVAAGVVIALLVTDDRDPACGDVERIFEAGSIHVLPGAGVAYDLSPPTSGPHELPPPEGGIWTVPLPEPRQVAFLEGGGVIVQYDDALGDGITATLEPLAAGRNDVIVAPALRPIDDGAGVALTAWATRQLCDTVDVQAAESFIDTYVDAFFVNHE